MQGTFLLVHLLIRIAFKLDASYSFIVASCVIELGLEIEASRKVVVEISEILLMVDPRN